MRLKNDDIHDFIRLYKEVEGEELTFEEADEIVHRMLDLFLLILDNPLPKENSIEKSPHQTPVVTRQ